MYQLINQHVDPLLTSLAANNHVRDYCWLLDRLHQANVAVDAEYQRRYKAFWAMNVARLSREFIAAYFAFLEAHKRDNPPPSVNDTAAYLHGFPTGANGRQTLQFSFASKLVHMITPTLPVYDRRVEHFYFLPDGNGTGLDRLPLLVRSYDFLLVEYRRIIDSRLLVRAFDAFRRRFPEPRLTSEKIIDSLIWSVVGWLQHGAVRDRTAVYA
jgi:hypothetical protein